EKVFLARFQVFLCGAGARIFPRRVRACIFNSGDAGTFKSGGILLGHAIDLVLFIASTEQLSKSLERRCQNLDDFVSTFFLWQIGVTCFPTRILEHACIGIACALDSRSAPHPTRGDSQNKSDQNSNESTFGHWSNSLVHLGENIHEVQERRAKNGDKKCREQETRKREQQLDGRFLRFLFCSLASFCS